MIPCACGETAAHVLAHRQTADGRSVYLHSDGLCLGALGYPIRGLPSRSPQTEDRQRLLLRAGWLLMGEVGIHDAADLPDLHRACLRAASTDGLPDTVRRVLAEIQAPRLTLEWVVTAADRAGRPTERQARLPRLRWPGLAVIDYCGGAGSSRGRYHLVEVIDRERPDVCRATGFEFSSLAALTEYLTSIGGAQ